MEFFISLVANDSLIEVGQLLAIYHSKAVLEIFLTLFSRISIKSFSEETRQKMVVIRLAWRSYDLRFEGPCPTGP